MLHYLWLQSNIIQYIFVSYQRRPQVSEIACFFLFCVKMLKGCTMFI